MPNPLYKQLQGSQGGNPILQRLMDFKKNFTGNPQQIVQNMLNSGKLTQSQFNQYAQRTNEIYRQFKDFM